METDSTADTPLAADRASSPNSWVAVIVGLVVCVVAFALLAIVINQHLSTRPVNLRSYSMELSARVEQLFLDNLVSPENVRRSELKLVETNRASWLHTALEIDIEDRQLAGLEAVLMREMTRQDVAVTRGEGCDLTQRFHLAVAGCRFADVILNRPPPPKMPEIADDDPVLLELRALAGLAGALDAPRPTLEERQSPAPVLAKPVVAIILDDGGYGGEVTESILALDPRLTLAILPGAPYAAETARRAAEAGFEVILHLPMESPEGPGWITTSMPPEEMQRLLDEALGRVPGAVGINNHMGSTFSADWQALGVFFELLKTRPLFFIDSRTTHKSLIPAAAREAGVPVAERDVFLDNDPDEDSIEEQFHELMDLARENGSAIGIGHFRPATVRALELLAPELEKSGINLVHASEVVQ